MSRVLEASADRVDIWFRVGYASINERGKMHIHSFEVLRNPTIVLANSFDRAKELVNDEAKALLSQAGLGADAYGLTFTLKRVRYSMSYEMEEALNDDFDGVACPSGNIEIAFIFTGKAQALDATE